MKNSRSTCKAWCLMAAASALGALPVAHAVVLAELRVQSRIFPNFRLDESGILGDSFGAKELVMQGLPTTRAAVEGNLSAGTLRAVAQTDYFRADFDPTGFSDSYTTASARVTMGDSVTFNNVAIGDVGHLDLLVTGSFSTVPDARRIPYGIANAVVGVSSQDRRVILTRRKWFAADANSLVRVQSFSAEAIVGSSVSYLDTVSFELQPGRTTSSGCWRWESTDTTPTSAAPRVRFCVCRRG